MEQRAYLLALEIDPMQIGTTYTALPLHCTVMHWFRASQPPSRVLDATRSVFAKTPPLELISEAPALFGPKRNVPVHTLRPTEGLHMLHAHLFDALGQLGVEHTAPEYVGAIREEDEGWHPHVSSLGERAFMPGVCAVA